jgi:hypothetical protein
VIFLRNLIAASFCFAALVFAIASAKAQPRSDTAKAAIYRVFGANGPKAYAVAYCESRLSIWARNSSGHLGLFQQSQGSRETYYHPTRDGYWWGWWAQVRSAHRQFVAEGWSPWECA